MKKTANDTEQVLATYTLTADQVPAEVTIVIAGHEMVPLYKIALPKLGSGTEALLSSLQDEFAEHVPLEVEEITDPQKLAVKKKAFFEQVTKILEHHLPGSKNILVIAGIVVQRMYGLGFIDLLMADDNLEEIVFNGSTQSLAVYHKKRGWCKTDITIKDEEEVYNISSQIGRKVGREINSLHPIMDAHLLSGDRVASTLFPISTGGNTITIRRFSRTPWTILHLMSEEFHTISLEMAAILWLAIQYEMNILVAGGTASGKTSVLSALGALMPPNQRIISIEDTREISLPDGLHWNWVPLTSRNPNPEGKGEVTMLDLMVSSLRMRPDRIIVGEVRRKAQAETMFEAMHTGHSVYTTLHADTVEQVKRRLLEEPIAIPKVQAQSLHLVLVQFRDRRRGLRRSLELAEVLSNRDDFEFNYLYRWRPRVDKFEKVNESIRLFEDLNIHTGMTPQEIDGDLAEKKKIFQWMLKHDAKDIHIVGKVMRLYYKDKSIILNAIRSRVTPEDL